MSIELTPVGVACNLACPYCYEHPMRDAGNLSAGYDLEAMKRGLEAEGGEWLLFGGEPLLMKFDDLAEILRWGFARHGRTAVQTNGALITDRHLALFAECRTHVGISVDGPGALNDSRWAGSLEKTRAATATTMAAIEALCAAGRPPSLIVTLHRGNASAEPLPELIAWLIDLDRRGITSARIHALEIDHEDVRAGLALSEDENVAAFLAIMQLQNRLTRLRFDVFKDMAGLLTSAAQGSCIWNGCDPLTTPAVQGVNGAGGRSNCSRTNKDGVDWVKADRHGAERYLVLHQTPQTDGGCQGCRFFFACKGQCPGTAIDGDWRNRSEQCGLWYRLFEAIEQDLVAVGVKPISLDSPRRQAVEAALLADWTAGRGGNREHGDHWDAPDGTSHTDAGFALHGDAGVTTTHGDVAHGDHTDAP